MLDEKLAPALGRADCEHMAALIKSTDDLPPLLTSFYRIGASRNGWLVHGSLPGQADVDRERLRGAGLDVGRLEASGQLSVLELDLSVTPEEWVRPWSELLDDRLAAGYDALWFARFPVGPTESDVAGVLPFEGAWMRCFRGRRVVTLCPYIVGGMSSRDRDAHAAQVLSVHDRLVDISAGAPMWDRAS